MGFPNIKCCESPQNKNKELVLQCSSWAGWFKDATKAFKPGRCCCQVWDTLCGPAKSRSQNPKIQISSFLPGPQQSSENFPNQYVLRMPDRSSECSYAAPSHNSKATAASCVPIHPKQPSWHHNIRKVESFISNHLIKMVFAATSSHGRQVQRGRLFSIDLAPYIGMLAQACASPIMDRMCILQPIQVKLVCATLILPFSNCWFWLYNVDVL